MSARAQESSPLREVVKIVAPCDDQTYRLMNTVQLGEMIYVLHTFQKKAHHGIATRKRELALIARRLQIAKRIARKD